MKYLYICLFIFVAVIFLIPKSEARISRVSEFDSYGTFEPNIEPIEDHRDEGWDLSELPLHVKLQIRLAVLFVRLGFMKMFRRFAQPFSRK